MCLTRHTMRNQEYHGDYLIKSFEMYVLGDTKPTKFRII